MTAFYPQKRTRLFISLLLILALSAVVTGPAFAATFNLGCHADPAVNGANLANTIASANANGQADIITLTGGCTYMLTSVNNSTNGDNGLPVITSPISIEGNGALITRSVSAPAFRIFYVSATGNLSLNNVTITNGLLQVAGSAAYVNNGGGIFSFGTLTIANSTIANNMVNDSGSAIYNRSSSATIVNTTIANNTNHNSTASGGALSASFGASMSLINSTIAGNIATGNGAGGIRSVGSVTIKNTIFANNGLNCIGSASNLINGGNNIDDGSSCGFTAGESNRNPLLGPLANNGGLTQTMLPGAGSPAIDGGNNSVCSNMPVNAHDQRGIARPQGATCDIGAVEVVPGAADFGSNPGPNATISLTTNQGTNTGALINVFETGTADLVVSSISVVGSPEITLTSATSFTIINDSGVSENVALQCDAANAGNYTATVTIFHNGPAASAMYTVNCVVNAVGGGSPGGGTPGGSTGGTNTGSGTSAVSGGTLEFPAPPPLPPCVADVTNALFRATVRNMEADSAFCRVLAQDGLIENPGSIGDAWVISLGVIHAVDVFGPNHSMGGTIDICLQGMGGIVYLDASQSPRVPQWMPVSVQGGYTCTSIPSAGLVVLTATNHSPAANPAPASAPSAAPVNATPLTNCRVTTTAMVNLRAAPVDGKVLTVLPYDIMLDATARAGDWMQVVFGDEQGWVSAAYLTTRGTCG